MRVYPTFDHVLNRFYWEISHLFQNLQVLNKLNLYKIYSQVTFVISKQIQEPTMFTKISFLACLLISSAASAMTAQSNNKLDQEPTILLAKNDTTWSLAAATNPQGLTNVREFHYMGASGIKPAGFVAPNTQNLSFYSPVIDHDKQIASNTCNKQVAMNSYTNGNWFLPFSCQFRVDQILLNLIYSNTPSYSLPASWRLQGVFYARLVTAQERICVWRLKGPRKSKPIKQIWRKIPSRDLQLSSADRKESHFYCANDLESKAVWSTLAHFFAAPWHANGEFYRGTPQASATEVQNHLYCWRTDVPATCRCDCRNVLFHRIAKNQATRLWPAGKNCPPPRPIVVSFGLFPQHRSACFAQVIRV